MTQFFRTEGADRSSPLTPEQVASNQRFHALVAEMPVQSRETTLAKPMRFDGEFFHPDHAPVGYDCFWSVTAEE